MTAFCEARRFGVSDESVDAIESAMLNTPGVDVNAFARDVDRFMLSSARLDADSTEGVRYTDETVTTVLAYVADLHGVSLN